MMADGRSRGVLVYLCKTRRGRKGGTGGSVWCGGQATERTENREFGNRVQVFGFRITMRRRERIAFDLWSSTLDPRLCKPVSSQLARGVRTACYSLSASAVPHQPTMTPLPISPDSPCTLPFSTYLPSRPAHELSPKMSILRNGLKSMHSATPADSADPYTSLEQHHPSPDLRPKYFSGESGSRSVH